MSVLVATPHRGSQPSVDTFTSVAAACAFAKCADMRGIRRPYSVCNARNEAVRLLLESEHTHLMFVDEDVRVPLDCIAELLSLDTDIATGQVPCVAPFKGLSLAYLPVVTKPPTGNMHDDFLHRWVKETKKIYRCGSACILIRREVFEKLGFPWYRWLADSDQDALAEMPGEDFDFCDRAISAGFEIMVHGQVRCSHLKEQDIATRIPEEWETPHNVTWSGPISAQKRRRYPDYGSHLPVLMTLAKRRAIKTVVEFGAGKWSTPLFLDKRYFPDLEELISVEGDEKWVDHVSSRIDDDRFRLVFSHLNRVGDLFGLLPEPDLVLVDCDGEIEGDASRPANVVTGDPSSWAYFTYKTRALIYEYYAKTDAVVVMHDTQEDEMKCVIDKSLYRHEFFYAPDQSPATGVFCNAQDVSQIEMQHTANTWDFRGLPQ